MDHMDCTKVLSMIFFIREQEMTVGERCVQDDSQAGAYWGYG